MNFTNLKGCFDAFVGVHNNADTEGTNHLALKIIGFFCSILSIALDQDDFWKKNLLISIVSHQPIICNFPYGKVKGIYKRNYWIINIQCIEYTCEQAHSHTHLYANLQWLVWCNMPWVPHLLYILPLQQHPWFFWLCNINLLCMETT